MNKITPSQKKEIIGVLGWKLERLRLPGVKHHSEATLLFSIFQFLVIASSAIESFVSMWEEEDSILSKEINMKNQIVGILLTLSASSFAFAANEGAPNPNGPGFQCNATASNGVGRNGQTYWGDVKTSTAEAQQSAISKCDLQTSHGPCALEYCWSN